jgi:hexosaminidase
LDSAAKTQFGSQATGRDLEYAFVNWANGILRAQGKTTRIWNDQLVPGTVVTVDTNIIIDHWYGSTDPSPQTLADAGYALNNVNWHVLYGDTDNDGYPDPASIYDAFSPNLFAIDPWDGSGQTLSVSTPALRGMQMALWSDSDNAFSESHVATRLAPPLRALAQVAWGSPKPVADYSAFAVFIAAIGDPP